MISYVDSEYLAVTGTGADVTIASPAGTQPGDLLLLLVTQDSNAGFLFVSDAGWTAIGQFFTSPAEVIIFYRYATVSDPAVWTVTGVQNGSPLQILTAAYHTDNPRGLVLDAWQQGWFSASPTTDWTAFASTTRADTVIAVAASAPSIPLATMSPPFGFTQRRTAGSMIVADKAEAAVGQFRYPGTLHPAAQWASAALSVHERDTAPTNDTVLTAIDLDLVGQVRTIRRINATTNGAVGTPATPMPNGSPVTNSVWFRIVVPAGTTGPMRFAIPSPGEDFEQHRSALYRGLILWRLNGVDPTNPADMQNLDSSAGRLDDGLHNNCEGYAQGRDNYLVEYAAGGGEVYYLQVATYSGADSIDDDFTLEWTYDPITEPTELTGPKTPSSCPGTPLTTHGFQIAYYDAISGFAARFSPGRHIPYAPGMPSIGHAFYVEDVREFANLHIRRLIVGWTEATGPFLYGYLDHHGWARTWTADNEDPVGVGAASVLSDGVHQGIIFYDNPTHVAEKTTIRTIAGLGDKEPTYDWTATAYDSDMAWGGPGRTGSFFATDFTVTPRAVVEWDLNGNEIGTRPAAQAPSTDSGGPFLWCGLAGTKLYATFRSTLDFGWYVYSLNLATGTVTREQKILSGTVVGVRSSNGHIVTVASEVELYDPAVTDDTLPPNPSGEFAFPLVSSLSTWASTNGRHWNSLGVTADGKHLFIMLFYPLTPNPGGSSGSRDFVSDIWWMDLDTGVCEHKFFLAHPFHDTFMVPDTNPPVPTTNVRDVRLYRQADVGR